MIYDQDNALYEHMSLILAEMDQSGEPKKRYLVTNTIDTVLEEQRNENYKQFTLKPLAEATKNYITQSQQSSELFGSFYM